MTPEHLEALLWERIDGTLSAVDRADLETHLADNSEAKKLAEEVSGLADFLVSVPPVPSPAGLRAAINGALAGARPPAGSTTTRSVVTHRRVTDSWRTRLLPLAAGLLIGAGVMQLLHMGGAGAVMESSVLGTMVATPVQGTASVVEIELGPGVGSVKAVCDGTLLTIDAVVVGSAELQLVLETTVGNLRLVETTQTETSSSRLQSYDGRLVLIADGPGTHRLVAETEDDATETRLTVMIDQQRVAERRLGQAVRENQP
ncbi:MAG: hypothetical protein DRH08_11720 [Deltaproteobacteria bacterium]|nr:MAG: hypothetical protein DRH08_11720 [Deltaproteobacteria bacterium]